MAKKKTTFLWVLLAVLGIWFLFGFINLITSLVSIFTNFSALTLIGTLLGVIGLTLMGILIKKLFNVTKDCQKWVHIFFGFSVFDSIVSVFLSYPFLKAAMTLAGAGMNRFVLIGFAVSFLVGLAFTILMWVGITMHLKRAKKQKLMVFS